MNHKEWAYAVAPVAFARDRLGFRPDPKQAELLARQSRRQLLNCCRQWGKSTLTAALAVHRAFFNPGALCVVISPTARQSSELLRKAATFAQALDIQRRGDGDNEISLRFPNGARIVGLPGTEATIRGFSAASLVLIDEAARVDDALYQSVRPMLAASNGDLWLMSTLMLTCNPGVTHPHTIWLDRVITAVVPENGRWPRDHAAPDRLRFWVFGPNRKPPSWSWC